jgi:hypothetical protein
VKKIDGEALQPRHTGRALGNAVKHPRSSELTRLIQAVEKAGKHVAAVEVLWQEIDGREVPTWRILTAESGAPATADGGIKW